MANGITNEEAFRRYLEILKNDIAVAKKKNRKGMLLAFITDIPWYFIIIATILILDDDNVVFTPHDGVMYGICAGVRLIACLITFAVAGTLAYHLGFEKGVYGEAATKFGNMGNSKTALPAYLTVWGGGLLLMYMFPLCVCLRYSSKLKELERNIGKTEYIKGMTDNSPVKKKSNKVLGVLQLALFVFIILKVMEII